MDHPVILLNRQQIHLESYLLFSGDPLLLDGGVLCVARGQGGGEAPQEGDRAAQVVLVRQRSSESRPHRKEEDPDVLRANSDDELGWAGGGL